MSTAPPSPSVVFVLSAAEPLRGMEKAAADTVAALREAGLDVGARVLTPPPAPARRGSRTARARAFARSLVEARHAMRSDAPVVVLVGIWVGLRALPWRRPAGTRTIAWEHSYTRERAATSGGFRLVAHLVLPLYRRRADAVVAVSETVAAALRAQDERLAARTSVIANVVREAPAPPRGPRDDAPPQLLAVGGLEPVKNPRLLLDLLAHAPGAHLHVAGTGPDEPALRAEAAARGLDARVTFHGFTDRVPALLARADALVHTSRSETFGYALLEAAAAHVPVVAARTPQSEHLVPRLVPGATAEASGPALAAALARVLAAPPSAADLARADAARAREFSTRAVTGAWARALAPAPAR
ncbi:glycosyltransferase [Quadrisphaera sp. DSM 44207]|uniref:glycosyltransferase n=1 Tax=Quadrisphaera sp. DSM 44207 TaxID=1881057 RepID=UPI00115FCD19|nr:glycosyltransferase [Quadrisphaera sp. DSM 44207]